MSMNEQTYFFIKICIAHTLFLMFLWCVRDEWRQGQTALLTQLILLTIAALLPHLGWVCSTGGRWGPQPSVCKLALTLAFLSPSNSTAAGNCLCSFITPTCFRFFFRLFTQVHLLIDGSVKGQYITQVEGGARGIMVIVVGNGHRNTSSNLGWGWLHFT